MVDPRMAEQQRQQLALAMQRLNSGKLVLMAIFASTTLGSSDPSKAMSIKALEARAQALAAAQAKQEVPTSMPSPWQGASYVFNQAADAFATKRADQAGGAAGQDLANPWGRWGPRARTRSSWRRIAVRDPEIGKTYMQEIAQRRSAGGSDPGPEGSWPTEAAQTQEAQRRAQEKRIRIGPPTIRLSRRTGHSRKARSPRKNSRRREETHPGLAGRAEGRERARTPISSCSRRLRACGKRKAAEAGKVYSGGGPS